MKKIFYKPKDAWAADAIPYYANGEFHIFYLLDWRDPANHGEGTPWYKVTTKDFIHFTDHGEMLPRGTDKEFDMYVFTGSVIEKDGLYHIFYTGHNTRMEEGNYLQAVMHAVSQDLETWHKIPEDTFQALNDEYEIRDWRDPYVFFDEEENIYKMLLSSRKKSSPTRRRGTTALLISKDLKHWELVAPFWEPQLYYAHECPDLFRIGDWYYHVFSEFSHYHVVRYVMSRSLKGPWVTPKDDMFDGRAFYAAKTVSDGKKRYLIGWNPTKERNIDAGHWQWGGSLIVHEIYQRKDGSLAVRIPKKIERLFQKKTPLSFQTYSGEKTASDHITCFDGARAVVSKQSYGNEYLFEGTFRFQKGTKRIGFLLNVDKERDSSYGYFFEPDKNRVVFELFPNFPQYSMNAICVERPIRLLPNHDYTIQIIVEEDIVVAYINGEYALNARMYDSQTGKVGLMAHGDVAFSGVHIKKQ